MFRSYRIRSAALVCLLLAEIFGYADRLEENTPMTKVPVVARLQSYPTMCYSTETLLRLNDAPRFVKVRTSVHQDRTATCAMATDGRDGSAPSG
jgi:hypothetical protein